MSRRHRRAGHRGKAGRTWLIAICAVLILSAMVGAGAYLHFTKRATDRLTGCPTDQYDSVTLVLIDLTDAINATQAAALQNALTKLRNEVPKYGRLEIYPLKPVTTTTIEPLFAGCSPGSGRDVDSRLYGNPELADRLWQQRYADKVDSVIAEIRTQPPQDYSPVLEGIQSVAVTGFGNPLALKAKDKRLVVISDMIHHTPELSMYQGAPAFDRLKSAQYYLRIKPFLHGANFDVYLIVRETRRNVQQPPLYKFWVDFVAASDGFLRNWQPLQ
jgi:hypothetical protein